MYDAWWLMYDGFLAVFPWKCCLFCTCAHEQLFIHFFYFWFYVSCAEAVKVRSRQQFFRQYTIHTSIYLHFRGCLNCWVWFRFLVLRLVTLLGMMGDRPMNGGWPSLLSWVTILRLVHEYLGDGGWPSLFWRVTVLGMVGDHPGDSGWLSMGWSVIGARHKDGGWLPWG